MHPKVAKVTRPRPYLDPEQRLRPPRRRLRAPRAAKKAPRGVRGRFWVPKEVPKESKIGHQNGPHFRSVFSSNFALNLEHFGSQNDANLNTLSAAKGLAKAACT